MKEVDDGFYLGSDSNKDKYSYNQNNKNKYFEDAITENSKSLCIEVEDENHIIIIDKDKFFSRIKYYNYMEKKTEKIYNFKNKNLTNRITLIKNKLIICNSTFYLKKKTYKNRVYNNNEIFYNVKETIINFLKSKEKINNIKF
tara:strand:- start:4054 stop:4482 length:429 start_codon:yes stop_codon:yes gene_type:complete